MSEWLFRSAYLLVPLIRFTLLVLTAPVLTLSIRDLVIFVLVVASVASANTNQFALRVEVTVVGLLFTVVTNVIRMAVVGINNILEKQLAPTFFLVPFIRLAFIVLAASSLTVTIGDIIIIFPPGLVALAFTGTDQVALRFKIEIGGIDTQVADAVGVAVVVSGDRLVDIFAGPV